MIETKLTKLLGCRYPIIQTAMGWIADPTLTAATCNAGGFGFLAGATIPPEEMERDILKTKVLTDQGFGVNFHMYQPNAGDIVDLVIAHQVRAVSYSRSPGSDFIKRLKAAGVICMPTVGHPKHAIKALELGADAVTVQGSEGGGHTGAIPTSLLIPQVVDAVRGGMPIVAAGGFKDGRGLVAALAWGADGIAMGTRFLLTEESPVPRATKEAYLSCKDPGAIIVSRAVDGMPQRMVVNKLLAQLESAGPLKTLLIALRNGIRYQKFSGARPIDLLKSAFAMSRGDGLSFTQTLMAANAPMMIQRAMVEGRPDEGVLPSGQVAALIDTLQSCHEVIFEVVSQAEELLRALGSLCGTSIHVRAAAGSGAGPTYQPGSRTPSQRGDYSDRSF